MLQRAFANALQRLSVLHRSLPLAVTMFLPAALLVGCGSGSTSTDSASAPVTALVITQQPSDQTVPLGSSGTFAVSAVGSGTLTYQWDRNGTAVSGATGSTLATDTVSLSNSGDLYSVTVRDANGSLASTSAKLTVGPRSPLPGDLRFQQVGSAATVAAERGQIQTGNSEVGQSILSLSYLQYVGSPLELGPSFYNCALSTGGGCGWSFWVTSLPASTQALGSIYSGGFVPNMNSDMQVLNSRNPLLNLPITDYVVTSLAMPPGTNVYGIAATYGTQSPGFDLSQQTLPVSALQSTVANDGQKSRVVTAVAFDASGNMVVFSYGWVGDVRSSYDVTSAIVAPGDVASMAKTFADQGYILTAFGGDEVHGYALVGTKVKGDSLARPLQVIADYQGKLVSGSPMKGYAPVGFVNYAGAGDVGSTASYTTVLYEQ